VDFDDNKFFFRLSVVTLLFSVSNLGFLAFLKKKGFCSHSEKSVSKTFWHKDVWQLHVESKKKKKGMSLLKKENQAKTSFISCFFLKQSLAKKQQNFKIGGLGKCSTGAQTKEHCCQSFFES